MNDFESQLVDIVYSDYFRNTAIGMTKSETDAEDLLHDTVVRALTYRDKFIDGNLPAWIFTILRNTFINRTRKHYYHKTVHFDEPGELAEIGTEPDVFKTLEIDNLYSEISKLNGSNSEALLLDLKGYLYREIADMTNTPLGTVKSKIFFAKKQLKKSLHHAEY